MKKSKNNSIIRLCLAGDYSGIYYYWIINYYDTFDCCSYF